MIAVTPVRVVYAVSSRWKQAGDDIGETFVPGARLDPQPVASCGAISTVWTWRTSRWIDGHLAPYPVENHGADGWRWAGRMVGECIPCATTTTVVRQGTDYVCADCRAYIPGREVRPL